MEIFVSALIILTSVLLILIVLVQNSKGGGLASNFSASNQIMGVRKTTDFLEKATWGLAIALVVFCISASILIQTNKPQGTESEVQTEQYSNQVPSNFPTQQTQQPKQPNQ